MKVVFFGSSKYIIPTIEVLKRDFELVLVVTTEKNSFDPIPSYCLAKKIPYLSVSTLSDSTINYELSTINPLVGVLADFGLIIPKAILDSFPKGIINIHPSILPKYRGPTPVQNAILNGDKKTGVTLIKLDSKIDHGPILTQQEENILSNDTAETLYQRLFKIGAGSIVQTIELYVKGKIVPYQQDHSKATFTKLLTREDGRVDISSLKISNLKLKIDRMIRAYYPWPGVWTKWKMENARFAARRGKWKILKFLPEGKLQVEGKKPMSYKDFLNGYPDLKQIHVLFDRL